MGYLGIAIVPLKHKARVDERSLTDRAPLIWVSNGHRDVVNVLMEAGAYANVADVVGWTPQ